MPVNNPVSLIGIKALTLWSGRNVNDGDIAGLWNAHHAIMGSTLIITPNQKLGRGVGFAWLMHCFDSDSGGG